LHCIINYNTIFVQRQIRSALVNQQCESICTKRRQPEDENDTDLNTLRRTIPCNDDNAGAISHDFGAQTIRDTVENNVAGPSTDFHEPEVFDEPHE